MLREDILARMAELKLKGMMAAYDEIVSLGLKRRATPEKILHELLLAEAANREASSIRYRLGQARFPVSKDLDGFDWSALPREESRIKTLCEGAFLTQRTNVILVGGTGTGKTHLAIAIARQATLIVWGRRDRLVPIALGQRLASEIPGVQFVAFDKCGHLPQEESPEETAEVIARFVGEMPSGPTGSYG